MNVVRTMIGLVIATLAFEVHAADEPVVLISRFQASPGQEGVLEERLKKAMEYVRKAEPGVIYRAQRSKKDPSHFVFYEVFPSQQALDHHMKVVLPAFNKEAGPRPEGMLARPPEIERFQALD